MAHQRAFLISQGQFGGMADGGSPSGAVLDLANQVAKLFEDLVDRLDQPAVADQAMAAAAGQAVHRAGDGEYLAIPLHRMVGRGERPAPRGRLDHDQAKT